MTEIQAAGDLLVPRRRIYKAGPIADAYREIGTSGLRQYGGFVQEEWLRQLAGRKGAWVWREMQDNDPTVGAIMFAIRWLARGAEWRVEEGSQPEAAEFVEECMDDMSHTWGDFVSEALSMLGYGWALHESVYKQRRGPQAARASSAVGTVTSSADTQEDDSNTASSKYNDGKIGWRKLPIRAQETLLNWQFNGYSGIAAMHQIDWHGGNHLIPIEKAVLFRTQTTRNNPEGRSILRNAWTSYDALKNIKQLEAIGVERDLAGIPMITPPDNVDLFAGGQKALLAKVQEMVSSVRRDEYGGLVMPTSGWKFELVSSGGSRQIDTDAIVRRYRQDIATSMLADFVLIGQDAVGSFAMVDVKSDLFGLAIDGILDLICEVINRYAIPRLLALNGMDTTDPPVLAHGSAGRLDLEKVGNFLFQLSGSGAPIPWSVALLESLFAEAGLPTNFEEATEDPIPQAPKPEPDPNDPALQPVGPPKLTPGEEPFAREAHLGKPDEAAAAAAKPGAKPLSKADSQDGVMVALYPHPQLSHAIAQPDGERAEDLHVTLAYLGKTHQVGNPPALRHAVQRWAANTPPLTGTLSGVGRFTAGPEPVTYASVDLPDLPEHRQRLVGHLEAADTPASRDHGYTPHVTLAYGRNNVTPAIKAHALTFERVSLVNGSQREDFYLTGKPPEPVKKAVGQDNRAYRQGIADQEARRPMLTGAEFAATHPGADGDDYPLYQAGYKADRDDLKLVPAAKAERAKTNLGTAIDVSGALQKRHAVMSAQLEQEINSALGQLGEEAATAYARMATKAAGSGMLNRLVGRVMRSLNLQQWIDQRLKPLLANHAARVTADTQRTIQAEIGLVVQVADQDAQKIAGTAGNGLGMRDIEPQVRAQIMDAIRQGLAAGENPVKTADRIRSQVPAGRFVNAGARYRSRLIARDQTANMQREAAIAAYQSNPHITGVELIDGVYGPPRSDEACISRNGETLPIEDAGDAKPNHPLCTLGVNPIVSGAIDVPEREPALAA